MVHSKVSQTLRFVRQLAYAGATSAVLLASSEPFAFGQVAGADGYKTLTPSASLMKSVQKERQMEGVVRSVLKGDAPLEANQSIFDNYFKSFYIPRLTLTDDASLGKLPEYRVKLLNDLANQTRVSAVHEHLVDLLLTNLAPIVQDATFHPAVRYNCLAIIANLNATEAVRVGTAKNPPEPLGKAFPILIEELKKADNIDALRVGALIGIARHLEWDEPRPAGSKIAAPARQECITLLLGIANAEQPSNGTSVDGHIWMRCTAIDALAQGSVSTLDPNVKAAFEKLLADEKQPLKVRVEVAKAMGKINYKAPTLPKVDTQAKELGYLAAYACRVGVQRLENQYKAEDEMAKAQAAGGSTVSFGSGGDSGGPAGMPGMPSLPGMPTGGGKRGGPPGGSSSMPSLPGMPTGGGKGGKRGGPPGGTSMPGMSGGMLGGGGLLGGGMSGGAAAEEPIEANAYRYDYLKRQLRAQLYAVQLGLGDPKAGAGVKGLKAVATVPADVTYVNDVTAKLQDVIKILESKEPERTPSEFRKDLGTALTALEAITRKVVLAIPAAPAAPGAAVEVAAPVAAGAAPVVPAAAPAVAGDATEEPADDAAAPADPAEEPAAEPATEPAAE